MGNLQGKTVCVTGTFLTGPRSTIIRQLSDAGAMVKISVTRDTQILLVGDKPGAKLDRAKTLGIPIWDEQDMLHELGKGTLVAEPAAPLPPVTKKELPPAYGQF